MSHSSQREPVPAPDRHPERCALRGPPDGRAVHVQRRRQRLRREAHRRPQGNVSVHDPNE